MHRPLPPLLLGLATLLGVQAAFLSLPAAAQACIWFCPGPTDLVGEIGACSSPDLVAPDSPIIVALPDDQVRREGVSLKLRERSGPDVANDQTLLASAPMAGHPWCQSQWWQVQPEEALKPHTTYDLIAGGSEIASFTVGKRKAEAIAHTATIRLFNDNRWFEYISNGSCPGPRTPGRYWTAHVSVSATAQLPVKVTVNPSQASDTFPAEHVLVARPNVEVLASFAVPVGSEPCFEVTVETLAGAPISSETLCQPQRCVAEREFVFDEEGPSDERLGVEHWTSVPDGDCMELAIGTRPAAVEAAKPQDRLYCHTIDAPSHSESNGCTGGSGAPKSGAIALLLISWLLWRARRDAPAALIARSDGC